MSKSSGSKRAKEEMVIVSFKLSPDLYGKLTKYAKSQKDDAGKELSAGQAARRLMLDGLKKANKPR